jgi:hypothetical protein
LTVTFLTTEDAQAFNQQIQSLLDAASTLRAEVSRISSLQDHLSEIQEITHDLKVMKEQKSIERLTKFYESPSYKAKIIKEYHASLIKQKEKK